MYAYPSRSFTGLSTVNTNRSLAWRVGNKSFYLPCQNAYTVMRMLVCSHKCCNGKSGCGAQSESCASLSSDS